jgi:hypothetical protein
MGLWLDECGFKELCIEDFRLRALDRGIWIVESKTEF